MARLFFTLCGLLMLTKTIIKSRQYVKPVGKAILLVRSQFPLEDLKRDAHPELAGSPGSAAVSVLHTRGVGFLIRRSIPDPYRVTDPGGSFLSHGLFSTSPASHVR